MARTILIAVVILLGAGAPALAQSRESREHMQMLAELRIQQEQQQRLQVALNQLIEALKLTNATLAAQGGETTKGFADLKAQIDALATALPQLRSLLEQTRVDMGRVAPELEALRQALQIQLKYSAQIIEMLTPVNPIGGPPQTATGTGAVPPPATTAAPPPVAAQVMPASPTTYLTQANGYYASGDFKSAIDMFQEYLKVAPDSSDAPFAQMQLGHSYFHLADYTNALAAFRVVTDKYRTSDLVPEAYYFMGSVYEKLPKQMDNARRMYQLVSTQYKGTVAAIRAEERLKIIK
jgi:TolA-binding protein